VLLSTLKGAAVTSVSIEGVAHEFSSIPYVKEDVTEIILNLKGLNLRRLLKRLLTGLTYTIGAYEYVLPSKEHSLVLNRSLGCG